QALRAAGRFDEAREQAAAIRSAWLREYEFGGIDLELACAAFRAGDAAARARSAAAAAAHYDAAAAAAPAKLRARAAAGAAARRAFAADDAAATVVVLLQQLRQQPRNPTQLANLATLLGSAPLLPDVQAQLRLFLVDLAADLAPGDLRLQAARRWLLDQPGIR